MVRIARAGKPGVVLQDRRRSFRFPFQAHAYSKRAKLTISGTRDAKYYVGADRATHAEADLVGEVSSVPGETKREVHDDHGTPVEQDSSRPQLGRRQGPSS